MAIHRITHCHQSLRDSREIHQQVSISFCLPVFKVATQHPGSSSPVSLLKRSSTGVMLMWMASLSNSSLGCLAMSTTVVSSHLMACSPVTVNDAMYGHKNDAFPLCGIFAPKKTGTSWSKRRHVFPRFQAAILYWYKYCMSTVKHYVLRHEFYVVGNF